VDAPIQFTGHARLSLKKRGATEEEVKQAIRDGRWTQARHGRCEASKTFPYHQLWNRKVYRWKQVVPIFVKEPEGLVVITVYVFYF